MRTKLVQHRGRAKLLLDRQLMRMLGSKSGTRMEITVVGSALHVRPNAAAKRKGFEQALKKREVLRKLRK